MKAEVNGVMVEGTADEIHEFTMKQDETMEAVNAETLMQAFVEATKEYLVVADNLIDSIKKSYTVKNDEFNMSLDASMLTIELTPQGNKELLEAKRVKGVFDAVLKKHSILN